MRLEEATRYILEHAPEDQKQNFISWFMEGKPLGFGEWIDPEGARCLLGACFPNDTTYNKAIELAGTAFKWAPNGDNSHLWMAWDRVQDIGGNKYEDRNAKPGIVRAIIEEYLASEVHT